MAIVKPKFAAAEQKKRDVCIIGTGDGAELIIVDAETCSHLAHLTGPSGNPIKKCYGAVRESSNYDLGDLAFDSEGRCVQFLKPDVAAMEAELEQAKAEVARLREERDKTKAALEIANADVEQLRAKLVFEDDDESRMRWALERLWKFANKSGRSVVVYPDGDVFTDNLYKNTEAARVLVERSKK
jgi:hypothetical protein